MRNILILILLTLLFGCQITSEIIVKEEPKEAEKMSNTFDSFAGQWEKKASELLDEALKYLVQLDTLPVPDGVFGRFVRRLTPLTFAERHTTYLIRLIEKSDPYLQEAGLNLACAAVEQIDIYKELEPAICRLLDAKILDLWVLFAIVKFAETANNTVDPELVSLFRGLAHVAYEKAGFLPKFEKGIADLKSIAMSRSRWIDPIKEAKELLDDVMLTRTKPTPRTKAILPFLEKAHGTKGCHATRNKILKNRGLKESD